MKSYCSTALVSAAILVPGIAKGQTTNGPGQPPPEDSSRHWAFTASAYGYLVPESRDYVNLNVTADHASLHFEGRYNYEALETGSLWVGYNFRLGETLVFEAVPMLGGVFGNLTGVAPGWNLALTYKRFSLTSQNEYVFDTGNCEGSFFYTWSELTYSPWDWVRFGLAVQRTKAYRSELDIQRGFLLGFSYKRVDLTGYVFNLGWTDPTTVLAVAFNF